MSTPPPNTEEPFLPDLGHVATDARDGRVGIVVGWDGTTLELADTQGNVWATEYFRRPTVSESLSPRVGRENRLSRWRG